MVWVWVRHIGPSSNATAAATTTSSEHRSSSIPGMSWKIYKYHCQYDHNKSWEINVDEDGIQTYGSTSQFPVTLHLHRLQIHISHWNHLRIDNLKKKKKGHHQILLRIPSTYNFINNFPLLNVDGFIQLWSQTFQQPHPGNRFLA